jgi:hypothetical protein
LYKDNTRFLSKQQMAQLPPYTCPRCGYDTHSKSGMRNHLYKKLKACPAIREQLQLTDEVKEYILDNRVYRPLEQYAKKNENTQKTVRRKTAITQAMRIVVWNTYIGDEIGKTQCVCCKSNCITQHNFHCGHVVAEANGGKVHVDNLRPICAVCNNSMGTMDMKVFAFDNFNVEL